MGRILDDGGAMERPGFWKRHFVLEPTPGQNSFDLWFGVALPVACFVLDPGVLKAGLLPYGLLEEYRLFVYMVSAIQIGMLLCWYTFRRDLGEFAAPFAGVFIAGGLFSAFIGIVLLPLTIVGLTILIGVAGFTPFFTAFVYLRNGVRAMRGQLNNSTFALRYFIATSAALLVIAFPLFWSVYLQDQIPRRENTSPWGVTWDGD